MDQKQGKTKSIEIDHLLDQAKQTLEFLNHAQPLLSSLVQDPGSWLKKKRVLTEQHLIDVEYKILRIRNALMDFVKGG